MDNLVNELKLDQRIPVFYSLIHRKIVSRDFKRLKGISINETNLPRNVVCKIIWDYGVPKNLTQPFFEDMESYGLIKLKDKQNIEIL